MIDLTATAPFDELIRGCKSGNSLPAAEDRAIVALLRSVGHVFDKVDCTETARRAWCRTKWPIWKQDPIFGSFIEPARNALLKEFRGGLHIRSESLSEAAIVVDPAMPGQTSRLAAFESDRFVDINGRAVLPQLRASVAFWDRCLKEAETEFNETPV